MSEYLTIQKMFKANKFEIPSYQRAYSWETPQLKDFATSNNGVLTWDLNAIKKRKNALIEAALQIWSLDTI